ncbi:amino acid permease [Halococcus saccharolyticus]|uniref:Stress response protein/ transporter 3 (Substrates cationic amino acids) n=1 Tax=Halococcus saccharolyticus DSM 5350 TaxID=1227455 RepID=M0MMT4_9EURY|nr:amino acid permease [Halococcus saccharolyticus]EMA46029.1 stress response protein/ transporter 3 (substrates cationic amino acids) [Halococcus saccharolyticus DSM 5350]
MSEEAGQLERNLGFLEAMTLGGGTMIGAGIFILPGLAAEGAGPASSISFVIAGVVALLAAVSLSELATGMPIAGGSYHYVNRALGGLFGSIVGWGMWSGLMFASAFYMIGFGQYIVVPLPFLDGRVLVVLLGLIGLGLITGINFYGTDESSGAQNLMIGAELVVVLAYVALGVFFIEPGNLQDFAPTGPSGVLATTGIVFVTYLGFEIIATVAGEIEEPGRLIPLTMILSVVLVTILYAAIMIISTGVVPYQELGDSFVPVSEVASITMLGVIGVAAVTIAAAIAAISSSNSSVLAASRVIYAMGRDGLMSERLNVTHDRFATPHRAIMATGGVTGLLILVGLQVQEIVALLAQVASFSFLVTYGLVHIAVVVFRRADPDVYEPDFEIPAALYPAVPVLGVVMTFVIISQMELQVILVGFGVVIFGVVWYVVYVGGQAIETGLIDDAFEDPVQAAIAKLPITSNVPETVEPYRVVVPVANPETQRELLRLAAATARAHADEGTPELIAINIIEVDPSTERNIASERLEHQRTLLANARDIAAEMHVDLRTSAITAEQAGEAILDVIEEETADQTLLGWSGTLDREEHAFSSTIDPVVKQAPCDVSLVEIQQPSIGTPVALAGPGPHSPVAARRAVDFATVDETIPTLLNVQPPNNDGDITPTERGTAAIRWVAERAGLAPDEYESEVIIARDAESAILDAVEEYDTVCVGLSEQRDISRILFGSIAERISQEATGNVGIIRGTKRLDQSGIDDPLALVDDPETIFAQK